MAAGMGGRLVATARDVWRANPAETIWRCNSSPMVLRRGSYARVGRSACADSATCRFTPTSPVRAALAQARSQARACRSRLSLLGTTKCWPCNSNPVRLGSYVSRARARREIAGCRPGFWPQGQLRHPSSPGARAQLGRLPDPQPLADPCDEAGHRVSLRRFANHFPRRTVIAGSVDLG